MPLLCGRVPEPALAPPQPQENPDTGWTAIAAANSQESIFGKPVDEYISDALLIMPTIMVSPFIGLGKRQLHKNTMTTKTVMFPYAMYRGP